MKILHLSNLALWPLGKGKGIPSIYHPLKGFVGRGHNVVFVCPWFKGEPREEVCDGIRVIRFDFPLHERQVTYVQRRERRWALLSSLRHVLKMMFYGIFILSWGWRVSRTFRPDIVYSHTPASAYAGFLISRLARGRLVIRLYGVFKMYSQRRRPWIRLRDFWDFAVFKLPADAVIITNDGTHGDLLAREMGVPQARIHYWRNGIDEKFFQADPAARAEICRRYGISLAAKIIVSTCRLIYDYGVDRLIQAMADLSPRNPDVVCLIAGRGPEQTLLEAAARSAKIQDRVIFAGIVDSDTIKKILEAGDIFALLARFHNRTNTLWEAMAAGKCIVTTDIEGSGEILTSRQNAVLLAQDSIDETAGELERLLKDDALRQRLGDQARQRARELLETWPRRADREVRLLESLRAGSVM